MKKFMKYLGVGVLGYVLGFTTVCAQMRKMFNEMAKG
jgi:hypothetical protein